MTGRKAKRARTVREPLQVYLERDDRALLDRLAKETGLSRAEILRRGLKDFAAEHRPVKSPMLDFIESLRDADLPPDMAERHDDYLAEAYLDTHEECEGCRRGRASSSTPRPGSRR
ncbi:MAG: ribbon-helix-helix protein, CopG family [Gemmatimonadales bacterium]